MCVRYDIPASQLSVESIRGELERRSNLPMVFLRGESVRVKKCKTLQQTLLSPCLYRKKHQGSEVAHGGKVFGSGINSFTDRTAERQPRFVSGGGALQHVPARARLRCIALCGTQCSHDRRR